jgi:hypothetical protein
MKSEHRTNLVGGLGVESLNLQATSNVANMVGGEPGRVLESESCNAGEGDRSVDAGNELGAEHGGGSEGLTVPVNF